MQEITRFKNIVYDYCRQLIVDFDPPFQYEVDKQISIIESYEKSGEISCISHFFIEAVSNDVDLKDDAKILGAANVFAWVAYYIYDEIADEKNMTDHIGVSNVCSRTSYNLYSTFAHKHSLDLKLINNTYLKVDYCLSMEKLAPDKISWSKKHVINRSIGHILGPKLVAELYSETNKCKQLLAALEEYIFIKQLLDDVRDFNDDLKNNVESFVTKTCKKYTDSSKAENLRIAFLNQAGADIIKHLDSSIKYLAIATDGYNIRTIIDKLLKNCSDVKLELTKRQQEYKKSLSINRRGP